MTKEIDDASLKRQFRQLVITTIETMEDKQLKRIVNRPEVAIIECYFVDGIEQPFTYEFLLFIYNRLLREME